MTYLGPDESVFKSVNFKEPSCPIQITMENLVPKDVNKTAFDFDVIFSLIGSKAHA